MGQFISSEIRKRAGIVLTGVLAVLVIVPVFAQETTETPTPIRSIFPYDTCAPPCWMGLIPGESTAHDVDVMLEQNQDIILPKDVSASIHYLPTGELAIDSTMGETFFGTYYFHLGEPYFDQMGISDRIEIEDGKVGVILIHPDLRIPLADSLEDLGNPDIVRMMSFSFGNGTTWMDLIYLEPRLRVGLQQDGDECAVATLLEGMAASTVFYYSPNAAVELGRYGLEIEQPRLRGYLFPEERDVPLDTWQSWLAGEVDQSCAEAWSRLPEPEITPSPTLTPAPDSESG